MILKKIKIVDNFLGKYFSIEANDFIIKSNFHEEINEKMSSKEWSNYRNNEQNILKSPFKSWLSLLANKEKRKFYIFDEINLLFKKKNYRRVLEIGSGQGHVGLLLESSGVNIDLSEYDLNTSYLLNKIENSEINYKQINFLNINDCDIEKYNCILAVHVDYIFESSLLTNFLKKCKNKNVDVLFAGTNIFGPISFLKKKFNEKKNFQNKSIRKNGFNRSFGYYKSIGKYLNYNVNIKSFKNLILKDENWHLIHYTNN